VSLNIALHQERSMAKKKTKSITKPASKSAKKPAAKKPARKSAGKPASGGKKAASSLAPKPLSTGSGASAAEIGAAVCGSVNSGQPDLPLWEKYWSPAVESIEGMGMIWSGRPAMEAKCTEWMRTHTIHGCSAEGPYVGATGFSVKYKMDVTDTATGQRIMMEEIGVYTVKNGKVIREEFMYGGM
jgi:hypothetical protein